MAGSRSGRVWGSGWLEWNVGAFLLPCWLCGEKSEGSRTEHVQVAEVVESVGLCVAALISQVGN